MRRLFQNYDVKAVDSAGAGDAFNGGLATALSEEKPVRRLRLPTVSNLAVTRLGTAPAMPTRREIDAFIASHPGPARTKRAF